MSIKSPTEKRRNITRRQKKSHCDLTTCHIMTPHVSTSLFQKNEIGNDFYSWVNKTWVSDAKIPNDHAEFGASEEVEECIMNTSINIIKKCISSPKTTSDEVIRTLYTSFMDPPDPARNVDALRLIFKEIECVQSKDDLIRQFARLARRRLSTLFNLEYSINYNERKRSILSFTPDFPSLSEGFLDDSTIFNRYTTLLKNYGEIFNISGLEKVAKFEKSMSKKLYEHLNDNTPISIGNGHTLQVKFRRIPWNVYFQELGIDDWKKTKFEYSYPGLIRKLGIYLDEVPIEMWKLYIYKSYLISLGNLLPSPLNELHFEFSGYFLRGQKKKESKLHTFVNFIYDYLPDTFSKYFWDSCGDEAVVEDCKGICNNLIHAARVRLKHTEWLKPSTRIAAIDKVNAMKFLIGRPDTWYVDTFPTLDSHVFLNNVFILGELNTKKMITQVSKNKQFWEQGIFRVNAYYYETLNQIIIPYGILTNPFYKKHGSRAWNYGSLGFTIGHEMCHGFDDDGKKYDSYGKKKLWWTRADNISYNRKSKQIIKLYEKEDILGKHLDGNATLGENIADLGGIGIALEALKIDMKRRGVTDKEEIIKEYRDFFISYAVGWRTLYRNKRLKAGIETDVHSPAYLRVNLIVCHFDEWYDAFDPAPTSKYYLEIKDRIRFF